MSVTTTSDLPELVYEICPETGVRIVYDPVTAIYGAGRTALDALRDYYRAVMEHADVEKRWRQ